MNNQNKYLDEMDKSIARMRQYRDELRQENAWLIKNRYKIWTLNFVFWALILWGIFK